MGHFSDRELGMGRRITRRDFLNGVSLLATGAIVPLDDAEVFLGAPLGK